MTISSIALLLPTMRDSRCVPPVPGRTPRFTSGSPILPGILTRDADVGSHGNFQSAAHAVTVQRRNHQFGSVLQPQQGFVGVQTEVVLEGGIDAGQHLDIGAGGKKLVARAGEHDHVHVVVHARFENRLVQLPVHLVGVGIRRRIGQLDDGHAAIDAVVDQLFRSLAAGRLHCSCHGQTPFRNRNVSFRFENAVFFLRDSVA